MKKKLITKNIVVNIKEIINDKICAVCIGKYENNIIFITFPPSRESTGNKLKMPIIKLVISKQH